MRLLLSLKNKLCVSRALTSTVKSHSMSNFYIRALEGNDHFQAVFNCKFDDLNVNREFNFKRRSLETVEEFVCRMRVNLDKVLSKKLKKSKKKQKQEDDSDNSSVEININVIVNGAEVSTSNLICKDLFFSNPVKNKIQFNILNTMYNVVINCPWVDEISLPSKIMVGYPVFPNRFEISFGEKSQSVFKWFVEDSASNWTEVGTGYVYTPKLSDFTKKLKIHCTPSNGVDIGPEREAVSPCTITSGPGRCPFEDRQEYTKNPLDDDGLRVVSYNILADMYAETETARTELFPYCSANAISLDYRKQLYIKELMGYNADVICLQEVDEKVYRNELSKIFSDEFHGNFVRKGGSVREGEATFISLKKFRLLESHRIVLGEDVSRNPIFSEIWERLQINPKLAAKFKDVPSTLQVILLERLKNPDQKLVVANTHLYFHPDADHIRLLQGAFCMMFIEHFIKIQKTKNCRSKLSLIFCGDFNSTPDCGFYSLMTSNYVPPTLKDWKAKEGEHIENLELRQPFPMESAYGTPAFTNFTHEFVDCLDYIYYDKSCFDLIQTVPLPSKEVVSRHTAIPSILFPSDHLALIADFKWIN